MNQITIRWSLSDRVVGYGAAHPNRKFAVLSSDLSIAMEWGMLPQPPGGALMYLDISPLGQVIGQTHDSNTVMEFDGVTWVPLAAAVGLSVAVYKPDSTFAIVRTVEEYQATGGWRYCREDGLLVSVVSSYADVARGLYAWTEWADVAIGQGDDDKVGGGVVVRFSDDGILRRLAFADLRAGGFLRDIRAKRDGDRFAIAVVDYQQALTTLTWLTLAELRALPPVETVPPVEPPIEPPVEPPVEPPIEPPVPPKPEPPYPFIEGVRMEAERGWLIGPGDQVLQVDAAGGVSFVSPELSDAALLEATPIEGDARGRVEVRPVPHAKFLIGADATAFTPSGDVGRQYYTTEGSRGHYESWSFGTWPSGIVQAVVEYIDQGANHGRPFQGAGLTWVKQS